MRIVTLIVIYINDMLFDLNNIPPVIFKFFFLIFKWFIPAVF